MKSIPSLYRQALTYLAETRTDFSVIFRQCSNGAWILIVVVAAVSFWCGVWIA